MDSNNSQMSMKRKYGGRVILFICSVVVISILAVITLFYRPNQNALGALASVSMDIICIIIMIILVLFLVYDNNMMGRTTKLFTGLMFGTIIALFFDFLNWAFDGALEFGDITYIFTVSSLCMGSVLACMFVLYLWSYMDDMYDMKSPHLEAKICAILNTISIMIALTLAISKKAFDFVDGHYSTGVLYDLVTAIPILTIVYMTIYTIVHVKTIGLHDVIAVIGYNSTMIIGAIIEAIFSIGTTYVAISIANVFVFVMLQNNLIDKVKKQKDVLAKQVSSQNEMMESMAGIINEEKRNVAKWIQKSNTDELTGLLNRYAYENETVNIENRKNKDNFIYVSMDVNGLKVTNDTLGHEAGDELLLGASECLKRCFGAYGKLYRIGGDEFVALIFASESQLEIIKKELEEITASWRGELVKKISISCGYVTFKEAGRDNLSLHQMAVLADKRMYDEKTKYYQKIGVDRRGQKDAHVALCALYTKIFKINITDDTYQIINEVKDEAKEIDDKKDNMNRDTLSKLFNDFADSGKVYPEDVEKFREKTNLNYLRDYFVNKKESLCFLYRRKYGEEFKQVMMEIIPANDYSDDEQKLFLYVKKIGE